MITTSDRSSEDRHQPTRGTPQVAGGALRPVFVAVFVPMPNVDSPSLVVRSRRLGRHHDAVRDAANAYYECLLVLFASARRWNPEARLLLMTTSATPDWFRRSTQQFDLELIRQPFRHAPQDADKERRFVSSLYTLDAIEWIAAQDDADQVFILLDADTVVLGTLDATRWRSRLGYLGWPFRLGYDFNGLPLERFKELLVSSGRPRPAEPVLAGGEFYAGGAEVFQALALELREIEQLNRGAARHGEAPLRTEEHYLSLAVPSLPADNCLDIADRIWTAPHHRTVNGTESRLLIWHLPSEKGRGFHRIVPAAVDTRSWFWTAPHEKFVDTMGTHMGVTRRTWKRLTQDWVWNVRRRGLHWGGATGAPFSHGPPW